MDGYAWKLPLIYLVIAVTVTFVVTLLWGDDDDGPSPIIIGLFWPMSAAITAVMCAGYVLFYLPYKAALLAREATETPNGSDTP